MSSPEETEPGTGGALAPISLRDAIVAIAALDPNPQELELVFELLQLPRRVSRAASEAADSPKPLYVPESPTVTVTPAVPVPAKEAAKTDSTSPLPASLSQMTRVELERPTWAPDSTSSPLPRASEATRAPALPSLFAPLEARGICTAALVTWVEEGELDVQRAVDELARSCSLGAIPRVSLRTLRRGVQLLLDRGPNMEPFARDVDAIERALEALVGASLLESFGFSRCPSRGVRSNQSAELAPWQPPPRGMPVLVVSDFGVSGSPLDDARAGSDEWQRFAAAVRGENHQLIGLTPFAPSRWPVALNDLVRFVHWSERTSASAVNRSAREGRRG